MISSYTQGRRRWLAQAASLGLVGLSKPLRARAAHIRLVVPFSAGATSDLLARPVMQALSAELGQDIVIDNRPGAGGLIGAAEVARAAPDGLTLAWGTVSNHAIAPNLYPNVPFDALRDFTPIGLLCSMPHVVTVHPSVPAATIAELVALLRRQPGRWDYASSGNGTISHLIAESFKAATRTHAVHIPYRSSAQGLPDFLAGRVHLMFDTVVVARGPVSDGRARALAVTSLDRSPLMPEVPTLRESGVPALRDFAVSGWFGLYGPAGLPPAEVQRLNAALNRTLERLDVRQTLEQAGATVLGGTPQTFAEHGRIEFERWGELVRQLGVRVD